MDEQQQSNAKNLQTRKTSRKKDLPEKRKRSRVQKRNRRWTQEEESRILYYIKEAEEQGYMFEKPSAVSYYDRMRRELPIDSSVSQLKNKTIYLRKSYTAALTWSNHTGEGVEDGCVMSHILEICPHFEILNDIYGHKASFVLPYLHDTVVEDGENVESAVNKSTGNVNVNAESNENSDDVTFVERIGENEARIGENEADKENGMLEHISDYVDNDVVGAVGEEVFIEEDAEHVPPKSPVVTHNETTISRFKKNISKLPESSKGFQPKIDQYASNAAVVISKALTERANAMNERNMIDATWKQEEIKLNRDRFEFEKKTQKAEIELKMAKYEVKQKELEIKQKKLDVKLAEVESNERIKMRAMEMQQQIDVEKIKLQLQHQQ